MLGIDLKLNNLTSIMRTLEGIVFIDFDDTANAHCLLGTPFVASADFSLPVYFVTSSSTTQIIFGDSLSADSFIAILSTGVIRTKIAGVSIDSTAVFADGEEHYLVPSRDGSAVTVYVDGVLVANGTASGTVTLDSAGRNTNNAPFDGILSRPSFIDLTTPANSLYFKLNQLTKEYELPTNNVFGSEEIVNGDFANGTSSWVSGSGSTLTASGGVMTVLSPAPDTFGNASQSFATVLGTSYEVVISIGAEVGSINIPMGVSSSASGPRDILQLDTNVGNVTITGHFVGDGNTVYLAVGVQGSGATVEVNLASIKEVTNYITYQNIALGAPTRDTYALASAGTQWVSDLRTINIAAQAPPPTPLFNSSGVLTCSGTLSCSEIIPCGV
jgi:hypothetical protein